MTTKRAAPSNAKKGKARQTDAKTPATSAMPPPSQERRFVDIDPWAVLLEQLMEVPEEEPAGCKGGKRE